MRRVPAKDAIFLYMETPTNHMHVAFAGVMDPSTIPGYSGHANEVYDRVVRLLESRLHLWPPFRQRLVEVPFGLQHPVFVEDPAFDIDFHVRRSAIPAPGGMRELEELVSRLAGRPLDRNRPLWEMYLVEGLEGGKWALVAKAHHVVVDGMGGNEMMVQLLDLTPEPREVDPPEESWEPESLPSDTRLFAGAAVANAIRPLQMVQILSRTAGVLADVVKHQIARGDGEPELKILGPRTIINQPIGPHRRVKFTHVSLADVKRVRLVFGTKVNDVVLAIVGRALRGFLEMHGDHPSEPLVVSVPISIRAEGDSEIGNQVSAMTVPLFDDEEDAATQLRKIAEATKPAKEQLGAVAATMMQDWADFPPPAIAVQAFRFYSRAGLARRHPPVSNLTISNVPGPPIELFMAGSRMETMFPIGPLVHGQALNVTIVSYLGEMHIGLIADRDTVPDLSDLAAGISKALEELLQAADEIEAQQ